MGTKTSIGVKVVRWIARILSLILVISLLAIFVGESQSSPVPWGELTLTESLMFVALGAALLGLLLAWRWELTGALLNIGGTVAFVVVWAVGKGLDRRQTGMWFLMVCGLLYLFCALSDRRRAIAPSGGGADL